MLPLNAGALAAAVAFALASGAGGRTSHLCLATLAGYLVIVHSTVLLTGLVGHLSVQVLTGVVAVALPGRHLAGRVSGAARRPRAAGGRTAYNAAALFPPLAATAAFLVWLWPHLLEATRLWVWDDYTYHLVYPALWVREHAIAAPPALHAFTMQAWYPLSASVVGSWFMAPYPDSRAEALAWVSLTGPLYAGLFVAGVAELVRPSAVSPRRLGGARGPVRDVVADRDHGLELLGCRSRPRRRTLRRARLHGAPGRDRAPGGRRRRHVVRRAAHRLRAGREGERGAGRIDHSRDHGAARAGRRPGGASSATLPCS